jgi:hypothetical protein
MAYGITMINHTISVVHETVINTLDHNIMINKPNIVPNAVTQSYILHEISN